MKTNLLFLPTLALTVLSSFAGPTRSIHELRQIDTKRYEVKHRSAKCFLAGETSIDLLAMYVDVNNDNSSSYHYGDSNDPESGMGGGIGLTHFYTRAFGTSVRAYWWDTESVVHSATASAIVRYPMERLCIAPYVMGGVGGHFDSVNQISGHIGGGLEYRLTNRLGLIADYTYTITDETADWGVFSLGVRIKF